MPLRCDPLFRYPTVLFVFACLPLLSCRFGGDVEEFVDEGKDTATIAYDANGGRGSVASFSIYTALGPRTVAVADGSALSKASFAFTGWNTEPDGRGTAYPSGAPLTLRRADVTLYARWKRKLFAACGQQSAVAAVPGYGTWTWGDNSTGQLGIGSASPALSLEPVLLGASGGFARVAALSSWYYHTLALLSDGTVVGWGVNTSKQTGSGNSAAYQYAALAVPGLSGVAAVAAGGNHSLALLADGTLRSWGSNITGQLGIGSVSATPESSPVSVPGLTGVTAIAAGYDHSLAVLGGTVWAWGANMSGQLGNGSSGSGTESSIPVQVSGLSGAVSVAAGLYVSLALKEDGTVWAWGKGGSGQLGDPSLADRATPVQVSALSEVTAIAVGYNHCIALKEDGTVRAWGADVLGGLGIGATSSSIVTTPEPVVGEGGSGRLSDIVAISAGGSHNVAVTSDGEVWFWGERYLGEVGGDSVFEYVLSPVPVDF